MTNRKRLVNQWVARYGTANQLSRLAEGYLSYEEVLSEIRNSVFSPLDSFPRFRRMSRMAVCRCPRRRAPCDVVFRTSTNATLTHDQYDSMLQVRSLMPDAAVCARAHIGFGVRCRETKTRLSLMVDVEFDGVRLSREYAL